MEKLIIDPEFRDKIPPLTEEEFNQLRDNILEDGEVYEPIITWNNIIVDGHNRWKIICENWELLKDKYRTKQMDFADKWEAAEWMYKKQLGRRNLTEEQKTYTIGKMYEARKKTHGGQIPGSAQKEHSIGKPSKTAEILADEIGVARETVKRSEKFAKGIDAIREENSDAADKVLRGGSGVAKAIVMAFPNMSQEEKSEVAESIVSGEIKQTKTKGWTKADRANRAETVAIIADMLDPSTVPEYTVDSLVDEIRLNSEEWVRTLRNMLADRVAVLTPETRPMIAEAITKYVMNEFEKVRDLVK